MTGPGHARRRALTALQRVRRGEAVNEALGKAFQDQPLSLADRHLATQMVYGVLRHRRYLDAWMKPWVRGRLSRDVQDILRMGFFQMGFLDRVPAYAVVHAAVELTKETEPPAANLVNAVLRRAMGHPPQNLPLSVRYSHPEWIVERWRQRYGRDLETILAVDQAIPPLTLRVNRLRTSRQDVLRALAALGTVAEPSRYLPEAIRVTGSLWLEGFAPYQRGEVSVQDESGMVVAWVAVSGVGGEPAQAAAVLDLAAGRGGKTLHVLERQPNAQVVAVDRSARRLEDLQHNAQRAGLWERISVVHTDARDYGQEHPNAFDRVILDAPCTGLGVLRRKVDARWRKRAADLTVLAGLQRELLLAAWRALKPGGALIYSTCSVEPEETVEQMEWALSRLEGIALDFPVRDLPAPELAGLVRGGMLSMVPGTLGMDGFFIARLIKEV